MKTYLFRKDTLPEQPGVLKAVDQPVGSYLEQIPTAHGLVFSLLWTRGMTITLGGLGLRVTRGGNVSEWQSLIPHQIMDSDGEFSCPAGLFEAGDQLELMIVAMAMDADVAAAAVGITDISTGTVTQVVPPPPAKSEKMDRGVPWIKRAKVTV